MTPPGLGGSPEAERQAEMLSSPRSRDQPRSPPAARWRHPGTSQKLLQTAEMFFRSALVMVADNKSLITNAKSPWTNGLSAHPHQAPQPLVAAGGTGSRSRWRENRAFASKQENKCPNCLPLQRCDFCPTRAIPRRAREQECVQLSGAPAQQSLEMGSQSHLFAHLCGEQCGFLALAPSFLNIFPQTIVFQICYAVQT